MSSEKSDRTLADVLLTATLWLALIAISPILIPLLVFWFSKSKYEEWTLRRFFKRNNGAKFFCYTSKSTGLAFIRENILPRLDPEVRVIYMSEKGRSNLGDDSQINTLIGMEAGGSKRGGYPCVAKVVEGVLVSESLNTKLYRTIARKGDPEKLVRRIHEFYSTPSAPAAR